MPLPGYIDPANRECRIIPRGAYTNKTLVLIAALIDATECNQGIATQGTTGAKSTTELTWRRRIAARETPSLIR